MNNECEACRVARDEGISHDEALQRIGLKDSHMIEYHGYTTHIITDSPYAHTHGLAESHNHLDIEVRLATSVEDRGRLIGIIVGAVLLGRKFRDGQEVSDLFVVPVRFVRRRESDRDVLRAVFPDPSGRWPGDPDCDPGYDEQLVQE